MMIPAAIAIGLIGGIAPLLLLAIMALLKPAGDPNIRIRSTIRAYRIFFWIGIAMSGFVALILLTLSTTGFEKHSEWQLLWAILWIRYGYPFLGLLLVAILFGLYVAIKAQRDFAFSLIAVHSSATFVVSFILLFRSGTALSYWVYPLIIVSYPVVCIFLSKRGLKKITPG